MNDTQRTAFNDSAPADERFDAQSEIQEAAVDRSEVARLAPMIEEIYREMSSQPHILKANEYSNIVPFPSKNAGDKGMQSVYQDEWQMARMGDYMERPGSMTFEGLRNMVDQTPVLSAVVMTRVRQVQAFCRIQETREGTGFAIRHRDSDHEITDIEKRSVNLMQQFVVNNGWEFNPRKRRRLKRDNMRAFMAKLVRDTLSMDSAAIETEYKRDRSLGLDGLYAVDGATIRLCPDTGYRGDEDIFALQVIQGRISTAYGFEDLIYEPRNPRSDVNAGGYGLSETELLVRVVTGFLNAMTLNIKGFSDNAIPKGMLHLSGEYNETDLQAFKRYWNAMVKGVHNSWTLPVMISKDQESKASFENFGKEFDEMYFSKWMTFLTSMICAIYGIAPDEINFESFSSSKSALSGSDTAERIADSKDKGLKPLLGYFESIYTDFIVQEFGEQWVFRWTGMDDTDQDKEHELKKTVLTVNEVRAQEGYAPLEEGWGEAPVNPSLATIWQQEKQMEEGAEEGASGEVPDDADLDGEEQHPDFKQEGEEDENAHEKTSEKEESDSSQKGSGNAGRGSATVPSESGDGREGGEEAGTLRKADSSGVVSPDILDDRGGEGGLLKANGCHDDDGKYCSYGERSGLEKKSIQVVNISVSKKNTDMGLRELRSEAVSFLKKWPKNGVHNDDTGWGFIVTRQDWKKLAKWQGQTSTDLKMFLSGAEDIVRHAVLAESHTDNKGNSDVKAVHRFYSSVEMGGKLYRVKLTVKDYQLTDGASRKNMHALTSIELNDPSESPALEGPPRTHPSAQALRSNINIVQLLRDVQRDSDGKMFFSLSDNVLAKANDLGVGIDDEIFFNHPEQGIGSGRVLAHGEDGCTVSHDSGNVGVPWGSFLGHKKRAERGYDVVDHGEAGAILKDRVTGKHHFVGAQEADNPKDTTDNADDADDKNADDERDLILKDK